MTRPLGLLALLTLLIFCAALSGCTATFTPGASRASWSQNTPDSWMGNFYSGSGPMGATGGGP